MDLREEFVLRAREPGANVAELCRQFGISRKTGYKWLKRFDDAGVAGLRDQSRRPHHALNATNGEIVVRILEIRRGHPRWGPKKIHAFLHRTEAAKGYVIPAVRTVARILERAGEAPIRMRRSRRTLLHEAPNVVVDAPNSLWTADFKGWWRTRDGSKCEPLTIRDAFSRYMLSVKLMRGTRLDGTKRTFERCFQQFGLPNAILVDNGTPFISVRARLGLTRLSAWWISLGIRVVRGRPGHPQDNGGHERMHYDMRFELEDNPAGSFEEQQLLCDAWVTDFNTVRPHEALAMRTPAELYSPSSRRYRGSRYPTYPEGAIVRRVDTAGHVKVEGQQYFVGGGLAGFPIALELTQAGEYRLWFYEQDLGTVGPIVNDDDEEESQVTK